MNNREAELEEGNNQILEKHVVWYVSKQVDEHDKLFVIFCLNKKYYCYWASIKYNTIPVYIKIQIKKV